MLLHHTGLAQREHPIFGPSSVRQHQIHFRSLFHISESQKVNKRKHRADLQPRRKHLQAYPINPHHQYLISSPPFQAEHLHTCTISHFKMSTPRPTIIGADAGPEAPFPLRMKGEVVSGFGRGSKEVNNAPLSIPRSPISTFYLKLYTNRFS